MEFHIGDCTYRQTSKINGKTQMKILAKISPLLASGFGELAPLLVSLKRDGVRNIAEVSLMQLGQIATPVARELAKMPDEDRDYIINACLSTVSRKRDGEIGWAAIWSSDANRAMFNDINNDFSLMLRIALGVFQETFGPFLPASLSNLTGAKQVGAASSP